MFNNQTIIGVIGSGAMGSGIAQVAATAGHTVLVYDNNANALEKAKTNLKTGLAKLVEKQKISSEKESSILSNIQFVSELTLLSNCSLVIEAIIEKLEIKKSVFAELEKIVSKSCVLASNTSSLSITSIAAACQLPERVIGIHFFNPATLMPLVEIIMGKGTSDAALAKAFDYVLQIKKTPIVVNDSRGFFTSRVIGTFVNEALAMLGEGVPAASIEQAGSQAGYPAPPLQLSDELNLELMHKIAAATRKAADDAGVAYTPHPAEAVVEGIATCYELLRDNRRFALLFDRSGSGGVLEDVTSESAVGAGRAILGSLGVDWQQAGWDDDDLDGLVEFMLRMLISLIVDPGDRAQTREALRNFLDRWVAPAVACKRGDWIRV